jgi:hypothetical protein
MWLSTLNSVLPVLLFPRVIRRCKAAAAQCGRAAARARRETEITGVSGIPTFAGHAILRMLGSGGMADAYLAQQ